MIGKEKLNWIIDTSASYHMTKNLEYLTDLRNIIACPIELPNDKQAMAIATCELKWLKDVLSSLEVEHFEPMKLYCDGQATLYIATNLVFHKRTKHIEVDNPFVHDEIQRENIEISYVRSSKQLADIFIKTLGK